jgi:Ca-activated chloride channel family protein
MRLRLFMLLLLVLLAVLPGLASAQTPVPPLADETPIPSQLMGPPVPPPLVEPPVIVPDGLGVIILHYQVTVTVEDQVATTRVEQTFFNPDPIPVEASYLFPIPEQAVITEFNMVVDGQTVEGRIMPSQEARAIYESIVRQRRDPALLQYVGRDLYQARIFPIPAGSFRSIQFSYSEVLPREGGLTRYRYPINAQPLMIEGPVPRFVQPIMSLTISVKLRSSAPLKAIYSSTHAVSVARTGDYEATVDYGATNVFPNSDFDLYWSVDEGDVGVSLLSYKPAGEDGYFLLLAAPQVTLDSNQVVNRDLLLVLDTSGSMEGEKIVQARNALDHILQRLNPGDRFNVVSFSTGVRQYARGLQPADQAASASQFVAGLQAEGSTDINRALLEALAQVDPARPTVVVFLTDGLPTVGETDPQRIMANVRQAIGPNVQLFSFGVGYDVDTLLLDTLSQENRGASAYVQPGQAIDEAVSAFYQKIATPVLSGLTLEMDPAQVEDLYPHPLPDLFAGSQLVLAGRYRNPGPVTVTLRGLVNGQEKRYTFDDLSLTSSGGEPFIARLWVTRKIGYLINQLRLNGPNQELIDEIVQLSITYGIPTPYTSFLVPEPVSAAGSGGPLPTLAPGAVVEVAKQVGADASQALAAAPAAPVAGEAAVQESLAREALRSADVAASGTAFSGVRDVLDKAFVVQAGLWVDTSYRTEQPKRELAFGSDEYFALLADHPEWAPYLAVGPNLIVTLDGVAYVITDTGAELAPPPAPPEATNGATLPAATIEATLPAATVEATRSAAVAVETAPTPTLPAEPARPSGSQPLCAAPLFGVGLLLLPGAWARRRRRDVVCENAGE